MRGAQGSTRTIRDTSHPAQTIDSSDRRRLLPTHRGVAGGDQPGDGRSSGDRLGAREACHDQRSEHPAFGGFAMRETRITLPELILVAGTRAALGAGLGLLLADRLSADQRRAVGWTLFLFGALSTIPLALEVFGRSRPFTQVLGEEERAPQQRRSEEAVFVP